MTRRHDSLAYQPASMGDIRKLGVREGTDAAGERSAPRGGAGDST